MPPILADYPVALSTIHGPLCSLRLPRHQSKAKAMIVTRSRLHAVRYSLAVRAYLKGLGHPHSRTRV